MMKQQERAGVFGVIIFALIFLLGPTVNALAKTAKTKEDKHACEQERTEQAAERVKRGE